MSVDLAVQKAIRARLQEHLDAGADHVALQPVHADGDAAALDRSVAALAP